MKQIRTPLSRPARAARCWSNVLLAALVFVVPLAAKLILQTAGAASSQQIVATPPMEVARQGHTATVLTNGNVLIAGGTNQSGILKSTEIYDAATNIFRPGGEMGVARMGHTASLLTDGRVLIAGGRNAAGTVENSAEIFDPAIGASAMAGYMNSPRSGHTATVLTNGWVFLAGGDDAGTAEIFDPSDTTFHPLPNPLAAPRWGHTATLFSDNSVLLAGGSEAVTNSLEWVNPDFTFSLFANQLEALHSGHAAIPTLDGKKLLIFGGNPDGTVEEIDIATLTNRL